MKDRIIARICECIEKYKSDQNKYIESKKTAEYGETRRYFEGLIVAHDAMIATLRNISLYVEKVFSEERRNGDVQP